jgi:hypothetical protein
MSLSSIRASTIARKYVVFSSKKMFHLIRKLNPFGVSKLPLLSNFFNRSSATDKNNAFFSSMTQQELHLIRHALVNKFNESECGCFVEAHLYTFVEIADEIIKRKNQDINTLLDARKENEDRLREILTVMNLSVLEDINGLHLEAALEHAKAVILSEYEKNKKKLGLRVDPKDETIDICLKYTPDFEPMVLKNSEKNGFDAVKVLSCVTELFKKSDYLRRSHHPTRIEIFEDDFTPEELFAACCVLRMYYIPYVKVGREGNDIADYYWQE